MLKGEGEQKAAAQAKLKEARSALEALTMVRDQLSAEMQLRVAAETKFTGNYSPDFAYSWPERANWIADR